jgi:RecB family exonuclease
MYPGDRPLRLSGSSLARMEDCALRWFFEHEAKAESARTTALGFGSVVHALAAEVAAGRLEADEDVIAGQLDRVWQALSFEARWQSPHQYAEAQDCVRRFLSWHAANPRTLLAAEHGFELEVPVGDRRVVLRGSFDRVEVDDGGRVVVVDLKTGARPVSGPDLARHVQLGVYQLAVRSGAVDGLLAATPDEPPPDTAAELVQLRIDDAGRPKVQPQGGLAADSDPQWVDQILAAAVDVMSGERFAATPGSWCSFCAFTASCPAVDHGRQVIE